MSTRDLDPSLSQATDVDVDTDTWTLEADLKVPGLTILFHPVVERIGERALLSNLPTGRGQNLARQEPLFAHPGDAMARPLGTKRLSRSPILLTRDGGGAIRIDPAGSRTAVEVNGKPLLGPRVLTPAELERGAVLLLGQQVVVLLHRMDPVLPTHLPSYGMVGESPGVLKLRQDIDRVADLDVPVLLRGETGTGKEVLARALHDAGPRRDQPFVAVNMAAIPAGLAAAELFGTAKGAFTGADRRRGGYFQRADGGTLFLDEIGETAPETQALLLRALETHEIQPVGAETTVRVDARIVSATDLDLENAVSKDDFRAPLLFRLAGFVMRLPPLRRRREDFGRLFRVFMQRELHILGEPDRLASQDPIWLPPAVWAQLALFDWPGNIRQLANVARQLAISNRGSAQATDLECLQELFYSGERDEESSAVTARPQPPPVPGGAVKVARKPSDVREDELLDALRRHRFRLQATADALGIPRGSLYDLIEKNPQIRKASELGAEEIQDTVRRHGHSIEKAAEELQVSEQALRRQMGKLGLQ